MSGERNLVASRRLQTLAENFRDKQYRDGYVASYNRNVLAAQMHNFRGSLSQAEYAAKIGKQKTVVARLENPAYTGWSLRTMLEIARRENLAVLVRFVDFSTFLKLSGDLSENVLRPPPYDQEAIDYLAYKTQTDAESSALKALFSTPPTQAAGASAAEAQPPSIRFDAPRFPITHANDERNAAQLPPEVQRQRQLAEPDTQWHLSAAS